MEIVCYTELVGAMIKMKFSKHGVPYEISLNLRFIGVLFFFR
jgi:hypothetical protein